MRDTKKVEWRRKKHNEIEAEKRSRAEHNHAMEIYLILCNEWI